MSKFVPLQDVRVAENRQRKEFDEVELQALVHSIETIGLLHAPVIREGDSGALVLVAGERRMRAVADIYALGGEIRYGGAPVPAGMLPVVGLGELSTIEAMEAELEENIRRVDLTWQERAAATAALAKLRTMQAEAKGEPPPTAVQLAKEVKSDNTALTTAVNTVRKDMILARHLDNPNVKSAKTADEALKILRREEQDRKNTELRETVGRVFTSAAHELHNVDCIEWMQSRADGTFDVILTDPIYGIGADDFGENREATITHLYDDSPETFVALMEAFAPESFRITKSQAHMYLFCDLSNFYYLKDLFTAAGWDVFNTPLIWHKPSGYRAPWPEYGPQRKYETILYAVKGKRPCLELKGDVLSHLADPNVGHAAQKPVALFQDLLKRSAHPGNTVLDPFCGSGPIFPAANNLKVYATGLELSPTHYGRALNRLKSI